MIDETGTVTGNCVTPPMAWSAIPSYWPSAPSFHVHEVWAHGGLSPAEGGLIIWQAANNALRDGLIAPIEGRYFVAFIKGRRLLLDARRVRSLAWRRLPRKLKKRIFGSR